MYSTVQSETVFFLTCILAGVAIAFLYDLVRISRRIIAISDSLVNGEDILFFIASAIILFYVAFMKNGGEVRFQGFLGGAVGVFMYVALVQNRFVNLGETVLKWLIKTAILLFKTVMLPVRLVLRALKKPVLIIAWYTGRALRRARRVARCQKARAKMRILSAVSLQKKK